MPKLSLNTNQSFIFFQWATDHDAIGNLEGLDPKGHTVISWSLNTPEMIEKVEPGTASLSQRVEAARRCQEMGYWVGFHFDPVIRYEGWERAYLGVIERLAESLDPRRIIWISLAGFRYTRGQKEVIRGRFRHTPLFSGEFFRDEGFEDRVNCLDDKHGIWRCHTIFNCVEACPKELNPTKGIVELRCLMMRGRL